MKLTLELPLTAEAKQRIDDAQKEVFYARIALDKAQTELRNITQHEVVDYFERLYKIDRAIRPGGSAVWNKL